MICLIKTGVNFRKISVEKDEGDSEENGRPKELCFEDFKGRFGLRRGRNRPSPPGISNAEPLSVSDFIWRT